MPAPTALFFGGNGTLSAACSRLAVERGFELTVLNRGRSGVPVPGVQTLIADATDPRAVAEAVGDRQFDVVVQFRAYDAAMVETDIELFRGRTGHYVYISSAAAYSKPVRRLPIVESTPLANPFWDYARDKIRGEGLVLDAVRETDFPGTIVRPSHTYAPWSIPVNGGWTVIDRMRRGEPIIVHGDGTSLWTLTHTTDFAAGLVGLLGNPATHGDAFHITSDEVLTWDEIYRSLGRAAGVEPRIVHMASDRLAEAFPEWAPGLLGDRSHSVMFDNAKIKAAVPGFRAHTPFWKGAREIVDWHDAHPEAQGVDAGLNDRIDAVIAGVR